MKKDNVIKIHREGRSYIVSEPGFPFDGTQRLPFAATHYVRIDGGFLVLSENYDRDHIRTGALSEHIAQADPNFITDEQEARETARQRALDLADILLKQRRGAVLDDFSNLI